jgi:hypothetical protein
MRLGIDSLLNGYDKEAHINCMNLKLLHHGKSRVIA